MLYKRIFFALGFVIFAFLIIWLANNRSGHTQSFSSKETPRDRIATSLQAGANSDKEAKPRHAVRTGKRTKVPNTDAESQLLQSLLLADSKEEIAHLRLQLLRYYSEHDPKAGARWLISLDPAERISGLLTSYGMQVVGHGGDWEELCEIFPKNLEGDFIQGALSVEGALDPTETWLKVETLLEKKRLSKDAADFVLSKIVEKNPEGALAVLDINESPENARFFFRNAHFEDQTSAIRTFGLLEDGSVQDECFIAYVRRIDSDDVVTFGNAMHSAFAPSVARDKWTVELVRRIYPDNLTNAAPFVSQISDKNIRTQITDVILGYARGVGGAFERKAAEIFSE